MNLKKFCDGTVEYLRREKPFVTIREIVNCGEDDDAISFLFRDTNYIFWVTPHGRLYKIDEVEIDGDYIEELEEKLLDFQGRKYNNPRNLSDSLVSEIEMFYMSEGFPP